jgi:hypothetical protein
MFFNTSNMGHFLQPSQQSFMKQPSFDPLEMMIKRKQEMESTGSFKVEQYNEDDVKELEEFCKKFGIIGFNCGRMSPKAALMMLKGKVGYREMPLQESKKQILHG